MATCKSNGEFLFPASTPRAGREFFRVTAACLISASDILPMFTCTLQMLAEVQQGGVITDPLGSSK